MKNEIQKFNFENSTINFLFNGNNLEMVNATEMLALFPKKKMNNFLRLNTTKEFIKLLEKQYAKRRIDDNQILTVVKGGNSNLQQGTWMCKELAMYFAQWLSLEFHLACNDFILNHTTEFINELQSRTKELEICMPKVVFYSESFPYEEGIGHDEYNYFKLSVEYDQESEPKKYWNAKPAKYTYTLSKITSVTGREIYKTVAIFEANINVLNSPIYTIENGFEYKLQIYDESGQDRALVSRRKLISE